MTFKQLVAATTLLAASPAFSATLLSDSFSPQQAGWTVGAASGADFLGRFNNADAPAPFNVTSVSLSVNAPAAGAGSVSFDLLAFNTLDDNNCCQDTLTFTGGGSSLSAYFAGYQTNFGTVLNPNGATIASNGVVTVGVDLGLVVQLFGPQSYRVTVPVTLVAGANLFTWSYSPLQSFGDESWGLDNVTVTGPDVGTSVVPVPGAALLLATGLAGFGFAARRRKA